MKFITQMKKEVRNALWSWTLVDGFDRNTLSLLQFKKQSFAEPNDWRYLDYWKPDQDCVFQYNLILGTSDVSKSSCLVTTIPQNPTGSWAIAMLGHFDFTRPGSLGDPRQRFDKFVLQYMALYPSIIRSLGPPKIRIMYNPKNNASREAADFIGRQLAFTWDFTDIETHQTIETIACAKMVDVVWLPKLDVLAFGNANTNWQCLQLKRGPWRY